MIRRLVDEKIRDMREMANYGIHSLADAENRSDVKVVERTDHIAIWVKSDAKLLDVYNFILVRGKIVENSYITGKHTMKRMLEFLES